MAWQYIKGPYKNIVLEFPGGVKESVQVRLSDIYSRQLDVILQNPDYSSLLIDTGNTRNAEEAYALIVGMDLGSISYEYIVNKLHDGESATLYNEKYPSYVMYFFRQNSTTLWLNLGIAGVGYNTNRAVGNIGVEGYDQPFFTFIMNPTTHEFRLLQMLWRTWYNQGLDANYAQTSLNQFIPPSDTTNINRLNAIMSVIFSEVFIPSEDDPYGPGGHSSSGLGGDGDFDDTSDVIDEPNIPSISVSNSGLIKIYNPSLSEMNALATYLITPNIFTALAQNVINLSDVIVGLCIVPFAVPDGGAEEVKLSVLGVQLSTGVQMHKAAQQFVDIDCGSYTLEEFWGNCMDYSPYTKVSIYLPYCGFYQLNADEVMGRTISVKYRCDIASGSCIAFVKVNGSVLYQFTGQCACQIPISNQTYDGLMSSMINLGASLLDLGVEAGSAGVSATEAALSPQSFRGKETKYVERASNNLADAALNAVAAMKPNYHHTGCLSSAPGFMAVQKPFLIIERPRQSIPENYGKFNGYPSNVYATIGDLSGYIEVEKVQLNIPDATVEEILECETLLMKGVII